VLQVHNANSAGYGGEYRAIDVEAELLRLAGHAVSRLEVRNKKPESALRRFDSGTNFVWSRRSYDLVARRLERERPDIVHVHNTSFELSPSVIVAVPRAGLPVIMTAHNYRLLCPRGVFYRVGHIYHECLDSGLHRAIWHRCEYNGSRAAVASVIVSSVLHRWMSTYTKELSALVALNSFAADLFGRWGMPRNRIVVRPKTLSRGREDRPMNDRSLRAGVAFAGQLAPEKGVHLLLELVSSFTMAWPLRVMGSGALATPLQEAQSRSNGALEYFGPFNNDRVCMELARVDWLVMPSVWYEGCPMVALEALAAWTPLLLPDVPSLKSLFGGTSAVRWFVTGDAASIRAVLAAAKAATDSEWRTASMAARALFDSRFCAESGRETLTDAYRALVPAASGHDARESQAGASGD
jgi:glycosyltransferase involved in cell wall biosynthesis